MSKPENRIPKITKSCFGCCTVEVGSKIIAWVCFTITILISVTMITGIIILNAGVLNENQLSKQNTSFYIVLIIVFSVPVAIILVINSFFLIGVYEKRPSYILPWILLNIMILTLTVIVTLVYLSEGLFSIDSILVAAFNIYSLLVVNSYYTKLLK